LQFIDNNIRILVKVSRNALI